MNVIELQIDGKGSGVFMCGECKYAYPHQHCDVAERCCRPKMCQCRASCETPLAAAICETAAVELQALPVVSKLERPKSQKVEGA